MIVIKVWCLPDQKEEKLRKLYKEIVDVVIGMAGLLPKITDQNDMVVLYPSDLMKYGLGEEIIVEITGVGDCGYARNRLARKIGITIHVLYPMSRIECFVNSFNPLMGTWSSFDSDISSHSDVP